MRQGTQAQNRERAILTPINLEISRVWTYLHLVLATYHFPWWHGPRAPTDMYSYSRLIGVLTFAWYKLYPQSTLPSPGPFALQVFRLPCRPEVSGPVAFDMVWSLRSQDYTASDCGHSEQAGCHKGSPASYLTDSPFVQHS